MKGADVMPSSNNDTSAALSAATKLRQRLSETDDLILLPGVYDGFSARIALEIGFDGLSTWLGLPHLGFATLDDMRSHAEMLANLDPSIPLVADADTGYGGLNMVARTVTQYARSGVAGLHIEDQVQTKRCGHLTGKQHGATPSWTAAEAKALGFRMMIVPFAAIAPAHNAIRASLVKLKETGEVGTRPDFSPRKLFSIVGLQEAVDFDAAAGGSSYSEL
ncbi:Phosphoenolpyruvate/pyruvate domain-containing protein [Colletotrichum falcatum]|nr:Phosphoenolpyruvate/pyruvate domain-containing protein [Colletotrichum falcatum]